MKTKMIEKEMNRMKTDGGTEDENDEESDLIRRARCRCRSGTLAWPRLAHEQDQRD